MDRELLTGDELRILRTPSATAKSSPTRLLDEQAIAAPRQDASLVELHTEFTPVLGAAISEMTHKKVRSRMRDEWIGTYSEFVFGQPLPTCCAVILSKVQELEFYLTIDPKILFPSLDSLFGTKSVEPIPTRPLSEIERTVTRLLIEEIVSRYAATWQHTLSLDLSVDRIEHNVQQMSAMRGSDTVYIVRYEVTIAAEFGLIELCLPWQTTSQIRQRLAAS